MRVEVEVEGDGDAASASQHLMIMNERDEGGRGALGRANREM